MSSVYMLLLTCTIVCNKYNSIVPFSLLHPVQCISPQPISARWPSAVLLILVYQAASTGCKMEMVNSLNILLLTVDNVCLFIDWVLIRYCKSRYIH